MTASSVQDLWGKDADRRSMVLADTVGIVAIVSGSILLLTTRRAPNVSKLHALLPFCGLVLMLLGFGARYLIAQTMSGPCLHADEAWATRSLLHPPCFHGAPWPPKYRAVKSVIYDFFIMSLIESRLAADA